MVKATFSLDDETMQHIRRAAARLGKPQSQIIREAVADFAARADRLSERERLHLLDALAKVESQPPTRSARAVADEIKAVRAARRQGGRNPS